jgi:biopolymer transport protein ExbD
VGSSDLSSFLDEAPELNITPLVDIMLVLLTVLMITTPVMVYEESINLPKGSKSKEIAQKVNFNIKIDANKKITFLKKEIDYKNFSDTFLLATNKINKESIIYISADKTLTYGDVMYILKSVKESGFTKVSLVTDG